MIRLPQDVAAGGCAGTSRGGSRGRPCRRPQLHVLLWLRVVAQSASLSHVQLGFRFLRDSAPGNVLDLSRCQTSLCVVDAGRRRQSLLLWFLA